MALFTNNYSLLITKGLGGPACCAILTAGFGLVCGCTIQVVEPPDGGGGGGSYAIEPGIYVPWPKKIPAKSKTVFISVKFSETKRWSRSYVLDAVRADMVVRAINVANAATRKLSVGVENVKHAARRVTALFKRDTNK
jgi:hypothetical protein